MAAPRVADASDLVRGFAPEGELEAAVAADPDLLEGLAWGKPREAHPEGAVGEHVADLLELIEREESGERRRLLRFVALVHDSFKYAVQRWRPKTGDNHHAMRARRFAERYTDDERLLATIELHDAHYHLWLDMTRTRELDVAGLERLIERTPDHDLLLRFVEIDGASEAKDPEPIRWFRDELRRRRLVDR
jgi:hypothetical protein